MVARQPEEAEAAAHRSTATIPGPEEMAAAAKRV
jgi:hypothetical protein